MFNVCVRETWVKWKEKKRDQNKNAWPRLVPSDSQANRLWILPLVPSVVELCRGEVMLDNLHSPHTWGGSPWPQSSAHTVIKSTGAATVHSQKRPPYLRSAQDTTTNSVYKWFYKESPTFYLGNGLWNGWGRFTGKFPESNCQLANVYYFFTFL